MIYRFQDNSDQKAQRGQNSDQQPPPIFDCGVSVPKCETVSRTDLHPCAIFQLNTFTAVSVEMLPNYIHFLNIQGIRTA